MFGVPIDVPTKIFCDNGYACENTKRPESTLTKKHHIIDYHHIREAVASGTFIFSKEHTFTNLADFLTNSMVAPRREEL